MPTAKKAQPRSKAGDMDSNVPWKWIYVIGALVAGLVAAFGFTMLNPYLTWILILVGILVGIFYFDSGDVVNFGIRYLLLAAVGVTGALSAFPFIGAYLTNFVGGVLGFLGPIALTMLAVYFWKRYLASGM